MQSNGGLTDAHRFQGKDAILSGPAGGIVGAVEVSRLAGFDRIIGFDMGGTSTDVTHYAGEYERAFVTEVAGVRLRAPMMRIHTVAAGGGSICTFDGARFRVGPESAGANPGPGVVPARRPADRHRLQRDGRQARSGALPARVRAARRRAARRGRSCARNSRRSRRRSRRRPASARTPEEVADGFLEIAVANMANAIKHISVERGYDVTEYTLCCFGGAGGQHACLVADALGMTRVLLHPLAGVLSAYGMGLADVRALKQQAVEARLCRRGAGRGRGGARRARGGGARRRRGAGHSRRRASRRAHAARQVRRHRHDARDRRRATCRRSSPSSSAATGSNTAS